jgi:glycolate oxidase iron-sulfur subunit
LSEIHNYMAIKDHYDEIAHCNHCGFCQVACPIFRSTGHESGVARGRLALLRAVIEGRLKWSRELEEPLFDCLLCGACTSSCFPAIPTSDLVIKARSEYLEKVGRKSIHRLLFDQLLPYPRRLHLAARAVALGKNTGTSRLARALGLLRIFGRDLAQAEDIVERLPAQPFRARFKPGSYPGQGQSLRIAYFVGCGVDIVCQAAGEATLALLKRFAKTVDIIENNCCGLPAWSYGDLEAARRLAAKNLPLLSSGEHDIIITDCSSCASFLKKYPALFAKDDSGLQEAAQAAAKRVRDVSEWLLEAAVPSSIVLRGKRVTFHDPCHASRGQKLVKLVLRRGGLLRDVPLRSGHAGPGQENGKPEEDRGGCPGDDLPGLHHPVVLRRAPTWVEGRRAPSDGDHLTRDSPLRHSHIFQLPGPTPSPSPRHTATWAHARPR